MAKYMYAHIDECDCETSAHVMMVMSDQKDQ